MVLRHQGYRLRQGGTEFDADNFSLADCCNLHCRQMSEMCIHDLQDYHTSQFALIVVYQ
jgi:pimeloyl-CoA synthetase